MLAILMEHFCWKKTQKQKEMKCQYNEILIFTMQTEKKDTKQITNA